MTWLRHGGCKVITFFSYKPNLCVCSSVPHQTKEERKQKQKRLEQPKPTFPTKSDLIVGSSVLGIIKKGGGVELIINVS